LAGGYGKTVLELAQYLLKNNFYSLAGTDLHHEGHLLELGSPRTTAAFSKGVEWEKFMNKEL
jgi:protein-tyrosine phosphatase